MRRYKYVRYKKLMKVNYKSIIKILGIITFIEGLFMLPCIAAALYFKEWNAGRPLLITSAICIAAGLIILTQLKLDRIKLKYRESYFIACTSWVFAALIGALPFYFCGCDFSFISCYFESVAGFSTTGCSVLDADMIPNSLLMWRALCHWLGGMGILVLLISIFPLWGINSQTVALAETPGLKKEKLAAKYSYTSKFLYISYTVLSITEFILLVIGPMDWFNAFLTTCSSISTAGLIVTSSNSWLYNLVSVRAVILIFTVLSSLNFIVYFMAVKGKWSDIIKNIETRVFLSIIAGATLVIAVTLKLTGTYSTLWQAVKDSLCQVVSFISTSGFYVVDYTNWPSFAIMILFLLLFVGGCSFSTSGSLKVVRVVIFFKLIKRGFLKHIHPRMVKAVMLEKEPISAYNASSVTIHILLYMGILMLGCLLLSFNNLSMEATITSALGLFSNAGVALTGSGNFGNFSMFNEFSQLVMTFLMIAGRLEMYSVIILFTKSFWKHNRANAV